MDLLSSATPYLTDHACSTKSQGSVALLVIGLHLHLSTSCFIPKRKCQEVGVGVRRGKRNGPQSLQIPGGE